MDGYRASEEGEALNSAAYRANAIVGQLIRKLNGKLTVEDKEYVEGAFRLLQNQFLHGPISALAEEPAEASQHTLLEALHKLFRLG